MRRIPFCVHSFCVAGLNLERFMNTLQKENVPLLSARRVDRRTLRCSCYTADLPYITELARDKGWKLTDAKPAQLSALLKRLRERPGVPIGAALALVLVITLMQFVWRVELTGAGAYRAEIAAYLASEGIGAGTPKARVDAQALERKLTYRYPELAWFHVYVYNVTLAVEVSRGAPMPDLPDNAQTNIVATRDGVVDAIRVFSGTPMVKPGDIVRKGQVLIAGVERGRDETQLPVRAMGEVIARCWRSHSVQMSMYEVKSVETGREDVATRLSTPWLRVPQTLESPDFLAYDQHILQRPVVGCFFPIWLETVARREVALETRLRDGDQVRAEAAKAAHFQLAASLRGYEIIDKWTDYCMIEDGFLSATATAEWRMDIGGESPP